MNHLLDITRRHFFRDCGIGVGKMALAGLVAESLGSSARAVTGSDNPLAVRPCTHPGGRRR